MEELSSELGGGRGLKSGWRYGAQIMLEVRGSDLGGAGRQRRLVQVVKVGVGHGLAGRDPFGRVVDQSFLRTEE